MDRFGLFVDAGYLITESTKLCLGQMKRHEVSCDYEGVLRVLTNLAAEQCGLPQLRTYWYDGAIGPHPQPTTDHLRIGAQPNVKVRLGRVIHGRQKGVDSMITRDLMTLARERAIAMAYLVAGDEDLREGVIAAQDLGVQVVLVGVATGSKANQSSTLINECDGHIIREKDFWEPYFSRAGVDTGGEPQLLRQAVTEGGDLDDEETVARRIGEDYCESWLGRVEADVAQLVMSGLPGIPKDIDAPMLRDAEAVLGLLRGREHLRREVRNAFASRLRHRLAPE